MRSNPVKRKSKKASPAQVAARAAFAARWGGKKRKANPVSRKRAANRRPAPAARANPVQPPRAAKRARKRKSNPAPAAAPVVQKNPTENPVKANRKRKRKQSRKQRAASLKNLRKGRRGRRRRKNPVVAGAVKRNPVKANRRRSRRRRNLIGKGERRVGARTRNTKRGRVGGYRRKSSVRGHTRRTNPVNGMMSNQGPFTRDRLMGFGILSIGIGLGFAGASFADRFAATRAGVVKDGKQALYGANAAAAILAKPNGMRLAVQAGGSLVALGAGYATRNMRGLPWLFGGLAIGFGGNLIRMLVESYAMPALLPAGNGEVKAGNRYYPLEQKYVQDRLVPFVVTPPAGTRLALASQATEPISPDPISAGGSILALGDGQPTARFLADGTVGSCSECGGQGGHLSSCSSHCPKCSATYSYEVQRGQNLLADATLAGIDPNFVAAMNGNKSLSLVKPGERVRIPFLFGQFLADEARKRGVDLTSEDDRANGKLAGTPSGNGDAPQPVIQPAPSAREPDDMPSRSSQYDPAE